MAIAPGGFALPVTVRGPRGWARHGLRLGHACQVLDEAGNQLASIQYGAKRGKGNLRSLALDNVQELFLLVPGTSQAWELLLRARILGRGSAQIQRFAAPEEQGRVSQISFTGARVVLAGDSVDKPDPLRPAWRFWMQGTRHADAEAVGQREVRIAATTISGDQILTAPLLLAWLLGMLLTEAATA